MDQAVARCLAGDDAILLSGERLARRCRVCGATSSREVRQALGGDLRGLSEVCVRRRTAVHDPVAERLGIPLHTWEPHTNALEGLEEWVRLADGPVVAGSLALYADAYRVAKGLGHRTVLSGEFAEFVCTLNDYPVDHLLSHGRFRASTRHLSMRRSGAASWTRLAREVAAALSPAAVLAARNRATASGIPAWIDRRKANEAAATSLVGPRKRWSKLQLSPFTAAGSSVEAEGSARRCQASAHEDRSPTSTSGHSSCHFARKRSFRRQGKSLLRRLLRGRFPTRSLIERRRRCSTTRSWRTSTTRRCAASSSTRTIAWRSRLQGARRAAPSKRSASSTTPG